MKMSSIITPGPAPCLRCANIDIENHGVYELGRLSILESTAKEDCPGCSFFLDLMRRSALIAQTYTDREPSWAQHIDEDLFLQLRRPNLQTTQVLLTFGDGLGNVFRAWPLRLCSSDGFELLPSAEYEWDNKGLGRIIAPHAADPQTLNLAKEWFHQCTTSHGKKCTLVEDAPMPTRLLHVPPENDLPLSLQNTKDMGGIQYAALSYCWGRGSSFQTTPATLEDRLSGFPASDLPPVLQDAVKFVRGFGIEWLWIDALCILQGDAEDWSYESALMADTYGNATIVICADHASSTDERLFLPRDCPVSHRFGTDGLEGLCLQHASNEWESMISHALYQRGWAFQERILAPRIIHFLRDQVAWECNTTLYMEGFRGRQTNPSGHFGKNHFASYFHQARFSDNPPGTGHGEDMDLHERLQRWNGVAQEISVRLFTVDSDTLPAVSGLATASQVPQLGQYLAGVWEYNPFLSMAWHVRYPQKQHPSPQYKGPSWSWVWTERQIIWHQYILVLDLSGPLVQAWRKWDAQFGPRLLHHHMLLKTQDPKGSVLEGSFIQISGFCRHVYIAPSTRVQYDEWYRVKTEEPAKGSYAFMDRWEGGLGFVSSFEREVCEGCPDVKIGSVKRFLCVQIAREKRREGINPKTLALVVEAVDGLDAFRRVGKLACDFEERDYSAWTKRILKLV